MPMALSRRHGPVLLDEIGIDLDSGAGPGRDLDPAADDFQRGGLALEAHLGAQPFELVMSSGIGQHRNEVDVVKKTQAPNVRHDGCRTRAIRRDSWKSAREVVAVGCTISIPSLAMPAVLMAYGPARRSQWDRGGVGHALMASVVIHHRLLEIRIRFSPAAGPPGSLRPLRSSRSRPRRAPCRARSVREASG